jgi:hypothetical protein
MVDARQILQPRFSYFRETDKNTKLESVILGHNNQKKAFRISKGITEYINDFEVYKRDNENLKFDHVKDLYGIMGFVRRDSREYLILIDE